MHVVVVDVPTALSRIVFINTLNSPECFVISVHLQCCVSVASPHLASKAVDCLLDSKWAKAKKGEEALFTTRESAVDYCNR